MKVGKDLDLPRERLEEEEAGSFVACREVSNIMD